MNFRLRSVFSVMVLSLLVPGLISCTKRQPASAAGAAASQPSQPMAIAQPTTPAPEPSGASGGATQPAPSVGEVSVAVVDENELAQAIAARRGSVVLVDYWATWCPSCIELFPHTMELAKKWRDRGLVVFTLSFDDPEDKEAVLAYLRKFDAPTENYLSKYGGSSKSVEAFAITNGAIPHYKLYDRNGNLREEFASGGPRITPEKIEQAVEKLLAE